jgi:hypothetical protein
MTDRILAVAILMSWTATALGDAKSDLQGAIARLTGSDSYSWSTSALSNRVPSGIDGKSQNGLFALTIANYLTKWPAFVKGDKAVIQADGSWQTPDEIVLAVPLDQRNPNFYPAHEMRFFKPPPALLSDLINDAQNIQFADGVYTADLADPALKEVLAPTRLYNLDRRASPTVSDDNGTIQIWVSSGIVTKYEIHAAGVVTFVSAVRTFQLPTSFARLKPRWMSVSLAMPRQRTMLPGGASRVRFR